MTDKQMDPKPFMKGQLRKEATRWWVLMRSPEAEEHRADFNRWLNQGGLHRAAYNRVANIFGSGKSIDWDELPKAKPLHATLRRFGFSAAGSVMLLTFVIWRLFSIPLATLVPQFVRPAMESRAAFSQVQFVTRIGEIRRQRLADGSWITLDTDTLVTIAYDHDERELRLKHGRARFEVAHERRPFVVDAGEGAVVAHGTVFDVGIDQNQSVHVGLLRGRIDVRTTDRPGQTHYSALRHLMPGQSVAYFPSGETRRPSPAWSATNWPSGNIDLRDSTLEEVLAMANRYSTARISLADAALGSLPVSGSFRVDNPRLLVQSLSDLLGLRIEEGPGEIVLRKR